MFRFLLFAAVAVGVSGKATIPTRQELAAKVLVEGLNDRDEKVRQAASEALKNRTDALPWLRRAARSADKDTASLAIELLTPHENKRQEIVAKALDACIRDGRIDLLTEWHHYWQPEKKDDLWEIGPRAANAGLDLYAKSCPPNAWAYFQKRITHSKKLDSQSHDGPCPKRFPGVDVAWNIRTDRLDSVPEFTRFASVNGPARLRTGDGGQFLVLGPVQVSEIGIAFVACDGKVWNDTPEFGNPLRTSIGLSVVVCRGNFTSGSTVGESVLLVDGDIDLTQGNRIKGSLIRASGEIRLPKGYSPENCTIEAHAKDATAPYKFFELADVGILLADEEEGLVVRDVKPNTPFGNCGIAKGDLIRSIDDVPAGHSEQFRKKLRRALVRQGDCLVTVVRGDKTLDLPVFFPLPK